MAPGRFSHQGGLRFAPNSEPNSSVRKEKKETMQVQTTAVDTLEDIQPRCDPALQPTSQPAGPLPSVFSCCSAWFQSEEKAPPPLPDASVRLFSIRFCVSPVFYLSNLSSSPSALPPLASRLSRLPSSFHSSPIPIFNLYPLSRRHHSGSARPSFTLFFTPLAASLCVFFFFLIL